MIVAGAAERGVLKQLPRDQNLLLGRGPTVLPARPVKILPKRTPPVTRSLEPL